MVSEVQTTAGAELFLGAAAPATYDKLGYEGVDWDKIGEVSNIPQFGKLFNVVNFNPIGQRGVIKRKGSYNNGTVDIEYGHSKTDVGQAAIRSNIDNDDPLPFKLVLQDGTHIYFMAMIMGESITLGTVDNIVMRNVPLELTSESDILFEDGPTVNNVTVTYEAGANGSIIGDSEQVIASGGDTEEVYASADTGFVFDQWSDASTDNPRNDTSVGGDLTVTAQFISE